MGDTFTVSGHSYELGVHVYCLWPLLQIVSTHVLFVATTMNSLQCTPPIVVGSCIREIEIFFISYLVMSPNKNKNNQNPLKS